MAGGARTRLLELRRRPCHGDGALGICLAMSSSMFIYVTGAMGSLVNKENSHPIGISRFEKPHLTELRKTREVATLLEVSVQAGKPSA